MDNLIDICNKLAEDWHEAGRFHFESTYKNLNYDSYTPKKVIEKKKYINLDNGNSGVFLVDKTDCLVYRIKSKYGVINRKKCLGLINELTGHDLYRLMWW